MAAKKTDGSKTAFARELAVVLLTSFSTNTWNAVPGDIVECASVEEKGRLLAAEYARELEADEPERKQSLYRMSESHAPVVVQPAPEAVTATKKKKAANEDDDDEDGDASKVGVLVTDEFFGAEKHQLQVYKFAGGVYNVTDKDGKTLNDKKLRKTAVVALINEIADKGTAD